MIRSFKFASIVTVLIIVPVIVFGIVSSGGAEPCDTCQTQAQVQSQKQEQVNNSENGTQAESQNQTQESARIQEKSQERVRVCEMSYEPQSEQAKERKGTVNGAVSELAKISAEMEDEELGDKMFGLAKNQSEAEDRINKSFDKNGERWTITHFILGPNYNELKEIKEEKEQNRIRIQEMNQVSLQVQNEAEKSNLETQLKVLEAQQTRLQENLNNEEGFSLFGWFFRMLYGY